jgi:uncharacterized protein
MSKALLRTCAFFSRLFAFPSIRDEVTIVWHVGEPLVLGVDYYDAAFRCIGEVAPPGLKVRLSSQTNGMLITERWCSLFHAWGPKIDLSIDGPRHLHDRSRKTRSGRGTFDQAIRGLQTLQAKGLQFSVISVLTEDALSAPHDMFEFYGAHGERWF